MSTKFALCFYGDDGNVVCQHHNGSWIVFPDTRLKIENASSVEEADSEEDEFEEV